jgi:hypothetical protein
MSDKIKYLRQFISPFIGGENVDAFIATLADQAQNMEDLSIAVNDQLSISTASEEYLDKKLAAKGITRPPDLGMDDDAFRQMGIDINATKQITEILHTVLDTFYGSESVRAYTQSGLSETYDLSEISSKDMDLVLEFENGEEIVVVLSPSDFTNPSQATAQEIADSITRFVRNLNIEGFALVENDPDTKENFIRIFGSAKGPYSMVRVLGGRLQNIVEFQTMRGTNVYQTLGNSTTWEITKNKGSTIRFRWYAGTQPALDKIYQGDSVLIYGANFESVDSNLSGTFSVTNVRPAQASPTLDSGWFEIELSSLLNLSSSLADQAPPANTISQTYSYTIIQNSYNQMKFFKPYKATSYSKKRFALAFEPAGRNLKIYLPASTKIIKRDLIGGSHLHMLYSADDFNGSFGSSTVELEKLVVVSDRSFRYRQNGYDNIGFGGTATIDSVQHDIEYVFRENGFTNVILTSSHNLLDNWSVLTSYAQGAGIKYGDKFFYANYSNLGVEPILDIPLWTPTVTFAAGQTVEFGGTYFVSLVNSNLGFNPETNPLKWSQQDKPTWTTVWPSDTIVSLKSASVNVSKVSSDDIDNKFYGPHVWDDTVKYTLTDTFAESREAIVAGENRKTLFVKGVLPNESGILMIGLNKDTQEGPIKYFSSQTANAPTTVGISSISQNGTSVTVTTSSPHGAVSGSTIVIAGTSSFNGSYIVVSTPTSSIYTFTKTPAAILFESVGTSSTQIDGAASTIILDPSYRFKFDHEVGIDVNLISDNEAYIPAVDGTDYNSYITGTSDGRIFCEEIMVAITALGIGLEIIIVYPSDFGLGNMGGSASENDPPTSDKVYVWGAV